MGDILGLAPRENTEKNESEEKWVTLEEKKKKNISCVTVLK